MENVQYINKLQDEMKKQDLPPEEIEAVASYAKKLIEKELPVIFDTAHLRQILELRGVKLNSYKTFFIKGNKKKRKIDSPSRKLKERQRWILKNILEKIALSDNCCGFVRCKSILDNAKPHVGKEFILNMDIKDFFPSINQNAIEDIFSNLGYVTPVARLLSEICCFNEVLPQGAPTSPYLSNIICIKMDYELNAFSKRINATYTRYADDITFSSSNDLNFAIVEIREILVKYGFECNDLKTHMMKGVTRKIVTGLLVNEEIKILKQYKRKLKQEIYYCKKFGVTAHLENVKADKFINYREHLYGKAYYIKMVEPIIGEKFLKELDEIYWY
nr:reverse transcriptase family protein [uncultured Aminipila sp.]